MRGGQAGFHPLSFNLKDHRRFDVAEAEKDAFNEHPKVNGNVALTPGGSVCSGPVESLVNLVASSRMSIMFLDQGGHESFDTVTQGVGDVFVPYQA